ncbi:MAG: sodium:solute symporter family protein [Promethearchaeota archaeon]
MLLQITKGTEWVFWVVIVSYLLFLAIAGIYAKKKTKTLEDFMVAGRNIGPLLLGLSFGVTYFSAVMIVGGGQQSWLWGLGVIWIASIDVLVGVFLVFILFGNRTSKLGLEFDSLTVPQMLSKRYDDPKIQTFTSVVILFFETIYLVSIYMGLSLLLSVTMPDDPNAYLIAVIICGIITIIYLNIGGAHGAIFTDAAESVIMLLGVVFIFLFGIWAVGGFDGLLGTLGEIEREEGLWGGALTEFPGAGGMGLIGYILVTSFGVWGMPQMISRFYTADKEKKTLKWGLVIATVWAFTVAFFAWWNGIISRAYFWEHDKDTYNAIATDAGAAAIPALMAAVLPWFLVGLFLAAVTAASLTTGEKVIMIAASGFSIDVYQAKTGCSDDKALLVTKITTTLVVVVAVFLAILKPDAVLALCMFAWSAMAAVILIPYVFGLFWKGGTAKAALYSGVVALVVSILWKVLLRGASLWAMMGLDWASVMGPTAAISIWKFGMFNLTLGSIHEFIISQVVALIAFPVISLLTKDSKPSSEFLDKIFSVMKGK